jgi:hypothetical protein
MTSEGKVKSEVYKSLASLELAGDVLWFERLNSGSIHTEGIHLNGCRKGTFDFIAVFQSPKKTLCVAFIEVKRNDIKAVYSDSQKLFKERYEGKHELVYFWLVQSGAEVTRLIIQYGYDRIADVQM